ncbi:hypothetical protein M758_5G037400 [Ceratodon purpureus]|nr:hypothetical protein M758_5G037400 [Ceratodon purpureus]
MSLRSRAQVHGDTRTVGKQGSLSEATTRVSIEIKRLKIRNNQPTQHLVGRSTGNQMDFW